jgi:hypothetical protein
MPQWTLKTATSVACLIGGAALLFGCAIETSSGPSAGTPPSGPPTPSTRAPSSKTTTVDAAQGERIKRIMVPLIQAMNHPRPLNQVKVGVIDDPQINAASAGGGEFYVTAGLLQKANDQQLMAVLAHEVAHDDLGHVAKAQAVGALTGIGAIIPASARSFWTRYSQAPVRSRRFREPSLPGAIAGRRNTKPTSMA